MNSFTKFLHQDNGNVAVTSALLALPILLSVGIAVDYSQMSRMNSTLQNHIDAAVLAGVADSPDGDPEETATQFFAAANDQLFTNEITFSPSFDENAGILSATAVTNFNPTFMKIAGYNNIEIEVVASAINSVSPSASCIYLMHPDAEHAFTMNSGAMINAPDCGVQVHSENSRAAAFNANINPNFDEICVAGFNVTNNYGPISPLKTSCEPLDNPYQNQIPAPTSTNCDFSNLTFGSGPVNLSPGVYCGSVNFNSGVTNITLAPGHYVIRDGSWNVNGSKMIGEGVTFYYADSSLIQFNSNVDVELSPPTSGPYKDILFHEKEGLPESYLSLNDSINFELSGVLYLPSRRVQYNSGSQHVARNLTMVFSTLTLNDTNWDLSPGDNNTASNTNETVRLIK
ncbi:MAG: pilus assembly protein [Rhizobiaceae bacterium]|nr:pilus assembly protein [Rhizobiaceae bacterium]